MEDDDDDDRVRYATRKGNGCTCDECRKTTDTAAGSSSTQHSTARVHATAIHPRGPSETSLGRSTSRIGFHAGGAGVRNWAHLASPIRPATNGPGCRSSDQRFSPLAHRPVPSVLCDLICSSLPRLCLPRVSLSPRLHHHFCLLRA